METVEKYHCGITPGNRATKWQSVLAQPVGPAQQGVVNALAPCLNGVGSAADKGKHMEALYGYLSRQIHSPPGRAVDLGAISDDTSFRCLVQNMAALIGAPAV